jgi:hypothetical protein
MPRRLLASALLPLLLGLGCGGSNKKPAVPVRVEAFKGKQPCVGANVVFHPLDDGDLGAHKPNAVIKEDGSADLSTYKDGDGAPVGKYKVTVQWRKTHTQFGQERETGPELFGGRYVDPKKTDLK